MLHKSSRMIEAACLCNVGAKRSNNEDNYYFAGSFMNQEHHNLEVPVTMNEKLTGDLFFAVFDGMGGGDYGEVASHVASSSVDELFEINPYDITPSLEKLCLGLNKKVFSESEKLDSYAMGTTMAALFFHEGYFWSCNIGDSKCYKMEDNELVQLSVDHVDIYDRMHRKPMLTQYLGIDPETVQIEPYVCSETVNRGDVFLICSDGLTDMVDESVIRDILVSGSSLEECVSKLVDVALENGGEDNITVIVIRIS
ncbi:MAG: serine/threonine-protein phosphatase [Erysipelotrichaceae bacterium]|nr:serine/threonine-protein phosphatase [Erysipelotrichaceae bacterium]